MRKGIWKMFHEIQIVSVFFKTCLSYLKCTGSWNIFLVNIWLDECFCMLQQEEWSHGSVLCVAEICIMQRAASQEPIQMWNCRSTVFFYWLFWVVFLFAILLHHLVCCLGLIAFLRTRSVCVIKTCRSTEVHTVLLLSVNLWTKKCNYLQLNLFLSG